MGCFNLLDLVSLINPAGLVMKTRTEWCKYTINVSTSYLATSGKINIKVKWLTKQLAKSSGELNSPEAVLETSETPLKVPMLLILYLDQTLMH